MWSFIVRFFFFFQAEDGIRDHCVTGVQTCALPISTHMRDTAASNPLGLAVGGLAVGFVIGTLLPQTRVENEQMGEMSDRLIDTARETASEAVDRGKQVAQDAVGAAVDTAKESGREQGGELTSTLQDRTQEQSPGAA